MSSPTGGEVGGADPVAAALEALLVSSPEACAQGAAGWVRRLSSCGSSRPASSVVEIFRALEREADRLFPCPPGQLDGRLTRLTNILTVVRALRDHRPHQLGQSPPDVPAETRRELAWIRRLAPRDFPGEALVESAESRADSILVESLASLAGSPGAERAPGRILQRIAFEEVRFHAAGRREAIERLEEARKTLWRRIGEAAAQDSAGARAFLSALADDVIDRSEDRLSEVDAMPVEQAWFALGLARDDVKRTADLIRSLGCQEALSDMRRMKVRLRKAFQDKTVRSRQLAAVGRRALNLVEYGIVFLILAVLAILGWLEFGSPDPEVRRALNYVDAGICALFIAEFGWRLALAPGRLYYFRRYFLVDLLPAIPWGFLFTGGQGTKALRGMRVLPRIMRPLRLLAFAVRGMDRLVRRYGAFLNRNIVMFEPPAEAPADEALGGSALAHLDNRLTRTLRIRLSALDPARRGEHLMNLARLADLRLRAAETPADALLRPLPGRGEARLEDLIAELLAVESEDVEDRLGRDAAERLLRFLGFLDLPLIRSLPFIRGVVPGLRHDDAFQALALAAQGLGRSLERFLETLRAIGDLRGVITGPQILDRLGTALVRATHRPSVRLLLFGTAAAVLSAILGLFPSPALETFLDRFISPVINAVLVIGSICLVLQVFGRWLLLIAGEAGELFRSIAEAQGINLLKLQKLRRREHDLTQLFDRVLLPEARLKTPAAGENEERARRRFVTGESEASEDGREDGDYALQAARVRFLYDDYLDGAPLHASDVKTTEQFLGNLDLMSIRRERLAFGRREIKALKKLDPARDSLLPTGPSLWFRFITESLAEKTARLVLEYNLLAVPIEHRALVPPERLKSMQDWLSGRQESSKRRRNRHLLSLTSLDVTPFTAPHFLEADAERDAQVEAEFGPEVRARLKKDRREMIRTVFGTFPYEDLPRTSRTLNPMNHYFRWFGRGRILILPVRVVGRALVVTAKGAWLLSQVIRDQLAPHGRSRNQTRVRASLEVARRKINRMRRPVFMACLELRARFDPEYLHARLPGTGPSSFGEEGILSDLDLIGSSEAERRHYRSRIQEAVAGMAHLEALLMELGWPEKPLIEALGEDPNVAHDEAESMRAVAIAFHADYQLSRTHLLAPRRLAEALTQAPPAPEGGRRLRGFALRRALASFLAEFPQVAADAKGRKRVEARLAGSDAEGLRRELLILHQAGGARLARRRALDVLARQARYPQPWSHQLVSLRTIQTLACLDVITTRRAVEALGGFEASESKTAVTARAAPAVEKDDP